MNKAIICDILSSAYLSTCGYSADYQIKNNHLNPEIIKIGLQLSEYFKSINLILGVENGSN